MTSCAIRSRVKTSTRTSTRATRETIQRIIGAGDEREELADTARRIVAGLRREELAVVIADWLEAQTAI